MRATGGAGNDGGAALTQVQGGEDVVANGQFFHRARGKGDANRVADPLGEQDADADGAADGTSAGVPASVTPRWNG